MHQLLVPQQRVQEAQEGPLLDLVEVEMLVVLEGLVRPPGASGR
jgi:hypothetical protein